jgi:hypothetical protein
LGRASNRDEKSIGEPVNRIPVVFVECVLKEVLDRRVVRRLRATEELGRVVNERIAVLGGGSTPGERLSANARYFGR